MIILQAVKRFSHTTSPARLILAVAVLIALMYNVFGYLVVFQVQRSFVRMQMQSEIRLSRQHVSVLQIFEPALDRDFRRVNDREFEYMGQLYDILYETSHDRVTTFYCIRDTREEILMAGMRKASGAKHLQNLFAGLITIAMPVAEKQDIPEISSPVEFPYRENMIPDRSSEPVTPPPRRG